MADALERARAGRALIDARYRNGGPRRDGMVNALGAELFGDGKLAKLTTCSICGCLGAPGDDCGRSPAGHMLTP